MNIKHITLWLAAAGLMMATAACSADVAEPEASQAEVTFTVGIDQIDSRAIGDGNTVDQLIFAVYDNQGNEVATLRQNEVPVSAGHATVITHLVKGQTYSFAFWAQKRVGDNANNNGYYNTATLRDVVVTYDGPANDERRDAFCASVNEMLVTGDFSIEVTLRRPFAQLDYVCNLDEWTNLMNANYNLVGSDITIDAGAYTHLDVLTGVATQPTTVPFTLRQVTDSDIMNNNRVYRFPSRRDNQGNYSRLFLTEGQPDQFWVSMNYLLATEQETPISAATMRIFAGETQSIEIPLTNLPIKRNHRTVVTLANLTRVVTTTITIDPNFGGDLGND